jgi:hypothetical protein
VFAKVVRVSSHEVIFLLAAILIGGVVLMGRLVILDELHRVINRLLQGGVLAVGVAMRPVVEHPEHEIVGPGPDNLLVEGDEGPSRLVVTDAQGVRDAQRVRAGRRLLEDVAAADGHEARHLVVAHAIAERQQVLGGDGVVRRSGRAGPKQVLLGRHRIGLLVRRAPAAMGVGVNNALAWQVVENVALARGYLDHGRLSRKFLLERGSKSGIVQSAGGALALPGVHAVRVARPGPVKSRQPEQRHHRGAAEGNKACWLPGRTGQYLSGGVHRCLVFLLEVVSERARRQPRRPGAFP